jgi:hypothetical protein
MSLPQAVQAAIISYQSLEGYLRRTPPSRLQHRFSFGRPEQNDKTRGLVIHYSESPKRLGVGPGDFCTPRNVVVVQIRIVDFEV